MNLIYAIGAIAAVYAMLLSPTFPRRALFGVVTFLVIGIGILWYNMDFTQRTLGRFRVSVILVGFVGFIFTYYLAYKQIDTYGHIVSERKVRLKEAKENNIKYLEFERYDGGIYIHGEGPFSETQMSKYYGIDIKLVAPKD